MDKGLCRNTDPATSKAAARNVNVSRLESIVASVIQRWPEGLTTKEIAEKTGLDRVTVSPRIKPLCNKGILKNSGNRRDKSIVWVMIKG